MTDGHGWTTRLTTSTLTAVLACAGFCAVGWAQGPVPRIAHVTKNGVAVDLRSLGHQIADELAERGNTMEVDQEGAVEGEDEPSRPEPRPGNVQVNDPGLDNIQIFAGFRPFVKFTQSETSLAAAGSNLVAGYNSSANQPIVQLPDGGLVFSRRFLSGFSVSNDGGTSWTSGFVPPVRGSIFTFGDPVVAVDRHGTFFYSGLGADAGAATVQVNKSSDGGRTWSDAVVVQHDNGADKDWMAVGPDPVVDRDNIYVTWSSFQKTGIQLRFARSTDGGATWIVKTIFAPTPDPIPSNPQNALQFTNPVVDPSTGRLYIPFMHFSNTDQDFLQILASDDAGQTFHFLNFNMPGAPDPTLLVVTQAGELIDCRSGGFRLAIHTGPDIGGRFGLRSFVHASRLTTQPAFAAHDGNLYLAWSNSTSLVFGDPTSGSNILFIRSLDGGESWSAPRQVNRTEPGDLHHVFPSMAIDEEGNHVHISYYTQHADGTLDLEMASSADGGAHFPRKVRITSTASALPPTNIRLSATASTNYDRTIVACYDLGEYQSLTAADGAVFALWGDNRRTVTEPVNVLDPLSGQTHPQEDVFFQKITVKEP